MNLASVAAGVPPAVEGGVSPPGILGSWSQCAIRESWWLSKNPFLPAPFPRASGPGTARKPAQGCKPDPSGVTRALNSERLSMGGTGLQPLDSWETADLGRWPSLVSYGPLALRPGWLTPWASVPSDVRALP